MPTKLIYISLKNVFKGKCWSVFWGGFFLNKNLLKIFINVIIQLSNIYYVKKCVVNSFTTTFALFVAPGRKTTIYLFPHHCVAAPAVVYVSLAP